jgi:hypothetical protein
MSTQTEQAMQLFSGFNTTDPDQLLEKLMSMFTTIASTHTTDERGLHRVIAILHTTEFVESTQPSLAPRLAIIKKACLNKLREAGNKNYNKWLEETLSDYKK